MKKCDEEKLLAHLGVVLYENLGEEYPGAVVLRQRYCGFGTAVVLKGCVFAACRCVHAILNILRICFLSSILPNLRTLFAPAH